jgi:broad specificity phosphatase PhoE
VEIVLVRHGQPDWEPGGAAVDDPGLTPHGHAQAGCVAEALAGERFDGFYVSPLCRAQETARPIAERLGLEPKTESWLRELDLPPMEGMAPEEVQDFFASARARELAHWWDGFPGGESFRHFYERIEGGVESLLVGEHAAAIHEETEYRIWRLPDAGSRLLVVAHEGTNAVILSTLLERVGGDVAHPLGRRRRRHGRRVGARGLQPDRAPGSARGGERRPLPRRLRARADERPARPHSGPRRSPRSVELKV